MFIQNFARNPVLVNNRLSAASYRTQTLASNLAKSQNFHAVPRQPGGTRTIQLLNPWRQHRRTLAYQLRRGVGLDPIEFVRERDEGDPTLVFLVPIGCAYRGLDTKD